MLVQQRTNTKATDAVLWSPMTGHVHVLTLSDYVVYIIISSLRAYISQIAPTFWQGPLQLVVEHS